MDTQVPTIQVQFDPATKTVNLSGNVIHEKLLVIGMLELAKEALLKHHDKPASPIVPAAGPLPPFRA